MVTSKSWVKNSREGQKPTNKQTKNLHAVLPIFDLKCQYMVFNRMNPFKIILNICIMFFRLILISNYFTQQAKPILLRTTPYLRTNISTVGVNWVYTCTIYGGTQWQTHWNIHERWTLCSVTIHSTLTVLFSNLKAIDSINIKKLNAVSAI